MSSVRVFALLLVAILAGARSVAAQSTGSRFEVGAQFSTLRLTDLNDFNAVNAGLGGRVSYDFSRWFAIEGELNMFPRDRLDVGSEVTSTGDFRLRYTRRRFEGFAGPKLGVRADRFGLFGTLRPGFARLTDKGVNCMGEPCSRMLFLLALPEYRTEFAMNMSGVLEYYPSPRLAARLDLGTTLIRHRSPAPPCNDCTSRNFSSRVGFGFRF